MQVIFYGAGSYLARNLQRLTKEGYIPVCVCDADTTKQYKPFNGRAELLVLPLEEALKLYPESKIYVTVDHRAMGEVLHHLIADIGLPIERIINYAPIEYRLGCHDLETTIKFRSKRIFVRCYWRRPGIDRSHDMAEDLRKFGEFRKTLITNINAGKETPCMGCENLRLGWYLKERALTDVQLSESDEYSFCNLNCCYCFNKARNKKFDSNKLPDSDEQLEALEYISKNRNYQQLELQFSTGEITVHPHRARLLELFWQYQTLLFTNAVVFNQQICDLMQAGKLSIVVSMDCGTRESFAKIKSVDCYDQVCANLVQYAATGGCIILKYIMLPGINDNERDCEGFIELAIRLRAVVQLSNDTRTRRAVLPSNALSIVCCLAAGARENNLLVIHEKDVFAEADNMVIENAIRKAG